MKRLSRLLATILATGTFAPGQAAAERVFVTAMDGEQGHGWLFGSAGSGDLRCWVVLPRHVAFDDGQRSVRPVLFETAGGLGGETAEPIAVEEVQGAVEAAGGVDDLAFAQVAAGPRPEECLSRLGLPSYSYQAVLRAVPDLGVFSMLPKSYGPFAATVLSARSESAGGGLLRLAAKDARAGERHFRKGISGAVAEVRYAQGIHPFAMIIQATTEQPPIALALRFDRIRAAFDVVERGRPSGRDAASETGIAYRIDGFEGVAEPGGGGPTVLARTGGCWRVSPPPGAVAATVTVSVDPPSGAIGGLTILQSPDCDSRPQTVRVEQRPHVDAGWVVVGECRTTASLGDLPACPLDLRGSRQLRLSVPGPGPVGLSALVVE